MLLADAAQAATLGVVGRGRARRSRERFWPGGLTLVLPVRAGSACRTSSPPATPTVGVRVPDHPAPRALAAALGPLPTTSANRSGEPDAARCRGGRGRSSAARSRSSSTAGRSGAGRLDGRGLHAPASGRPSRRGDRRGGASPPPSIEAGISTTWARLSAPAAGSWPCEDWARRPRPSCRVPGGTHGRRRPSRRPPGRPSPRSTPSSGRAMEAERHRQADKIELIASENYVFGAVLEAQGSWLTNKYAEGLPGQALLRRLRVRRRRRGPRPRPARSRCSRVRTT